MLNLPQPGMETVSSKLAGGFLSTEQAGKSVSYRSWNKDVYHRVSVWLSSYTLFFFFNYYTLRPCSLKWQVYFTMGTLASLIPWMTFK